MSVKDLYYNKYLKYKNKYLYLQSQMGGSPPPLETQTPTPAPAPETAPETASETAPETASETASETALETAQKSASTTEIALESASETTKPQFLRQNSTHISQQGCEPLCWAHGTTRIIMKLITTFFNTYFSDYINNCHYYYNTILCNINYTIFDCIIQIKKNYITCDTVQVRPDNSKEQEWSEEEFYALAFHFIFSTLIEQYGRKDEQYIIGTTLYILDYLKYINITEDKIKEILNFNNEFLSSDEKEHFDELFRKLVKLFNDVKEKLNNKIFNPICYLVSKNKGIAFNMPVHSISKYQYYKYDEEEIAFKDKIEQKISFSSNDKDLNITWTLKGNLINITSKTDLQTNIKHVLKERYYALFVTGNHVITITDCSGDTDNLFLYIKNSHGITCDKKEQKAWCDLINDDNTISLNELLLWDNKWSIVFFYPENYKQEIINKFKQESIIKFVNKNISDYKGIEITQALKQLTFTELEFNSCTISDNAITIITDYIKNKTLKKFIFYKCDISAYVIIIIVGVLMQYITLKSLSISKCKIDDNITQAIAEPLGQNSTLTTLILSENNIGFDGAKAIANALEKNSTLKTLVLDYNDIGLNGAKAIAEALEKNSTLKTLILDNNDIGNKGAEEIGKALQNNSTLKTLVLNNNNINDYGVNQIVSALGKSILTTLYLGTNFITNIGATTIADALKTNRTLKKIDLSYTDIDDDGVNVIVEALKTNTTIEEISFNANLKISPKIKADIIDKRIFFSQYTDEQKNIINEFQENTSTIFFPDDPISDDEGIAIAHALAQNKIFLKLVLIHCNITDYVVKAIAEALKKNNTLTKLELGNNNIGDDGAIAIAYALKTNRTLKEIGFDYNNIGDDGAKAIAYAVKTNKTINLVYLEYNKKISSGIKDHIKNLFEQENRIIFN